MTAAVRSSMNRIGAFLDVMGATISASAAVRAHRAPAKRDLRTLGIEPTSQVMDSFSRG